MAADIYVLVGTNIQSQSSPASGTARRRKRLAQMAPAFVKHWAIRVRWTNGDDKVWQIYQDLKPDCSDYEGMKRYFTSCYEAGGTDYSLEEVSDEGSLAHNVFVICGRRGGRHPTNTHTVIAATICREMRSYHLINANCQTFVEEIIASIQTSPMHVLEPQHGYATWVVPPAYDRFGLLVLKLTWKGLKARAASTPVAFGPFIVCLLIFGKYMLLKTLGFSSGAYIFEVLWLFQRSSSYRNWDSTVESRARLSRSWITWNLILPLGICLIVLLWAVLRKLSSDLQYMEERDFKIAIKSLDDALQLCKLLQTWRGKSPQQLYIDILVAAEHWQQKLSDCAGRPDHLPIAASTLLQFTRARQHLKAIYHSIASYQRESAQDGDYLTQIAYNSMHFEQPENTQAQERLCVTGNDSTEAIGVQPSPEQTSLVVWRRRDRRRRPVVFGVGGESTSVE
jgi:hypothetical protein